jgi:two-component system, NtrC family, sensor histidine kinase PilS
MDREEMERQLRWLMILRVVTVTAILISAFAIELLLRPGETLRPLFGLSAVTYGMVLLYAGLDRWLRGRATFAFLQLTGDTIVITGFVWITGGLDSPMSFLYLLPIIVASMLMYRRGGLAFAGVCWTTYAALILFGVSWVPSGFFVASRHEPARVDYFLVVHLVAFVTVALLASYLSERLRVQGRELAERRGAVARLQALNENIIESINSGLVTTDSDGRINFMNRGASEITSCAPAQVVGRSFGEWIGEGRDFLREIRKLLLADRRYRFERHFGTPDGRRIFLGIAVSNLHDRAGNPLGYIFIFQDLTEIQALEREVRLKERMAALGEMAAGMAHELRNPLAAISGAVQYLKGSLETDVDTQELMGIILRESQRLDRAIRDFLTFARPGKFAPERCDLVRLLGDQLKLLCKSPEFVRAHRVETCWASEAVWCEVDPNRLRQVFWNLATNALKAMPDGGTLSLTVAPVEDSAQVEIVFADEGVGMDDREVAAYFQPFHSRFAKGTGLGAAIVYRLVEEHGGRIAVESNPGKGTRVRIFLPVRARGLREEGIAEAEMAFAGGATH